ncbi:MAG TPA: tetratricopeptide repeat protein, partial [Thermomicrobiales bacterium]|nr:tetratricopeptide repeat protein [Thermomicrobiales bacterium]
VGRVPELDEICNLLRRSRLVTLTGPGGSGKTRLSIAAARRLADEFVGGVWFVDLAPLADPALVVAEVAGRLGVAGQADRSLIEDVADVLRDPSLIVLDNCEHLIDTCAGLADVLLRAAASLTILATSREALRVGGEVIWPAPPLRLEVEDDPLQVEAIQLFVERARLANPHFTVTDASSRVILDICRQLDGMPLAIELAAARTRVLPVEQLAARLGDALALLGGGLRTTPERQQSLRGTINWSYALLTPEEQALFRRLAVFAGGFVPEAVEEVCSGEGLARDAVMELLFHLADKSLATPQEDDASARLRMMEPLRQFALERIAETELATLRERHAAYFLTLAEQAAPNLTSPDATTWNTRLDTEHDNLRVALAWVVEHGDAERGLRLGRALWRFWLQRGYFAEGRQWMTRMLAMEGTKMHPQPYADVLFGMGMLALFQTDFAATESHFTACLDVARAANHRVTIASAATQLSIIAQERGDDQTAERLLEEGLAIRLELGRLQEVADSLTMLGEFAFVRSDIETAQTRYEESLKLQQETGDLAQRAKVLDRLAAIAITRGDLATARLLLEEGLEVAEATPYRVPDLLGSLAQVAFDEGDTSEAARLAARCIRSSLEMPRKDRLAWGLLLFATLASARGEGERALRLRTAAQHVLVAAGRSIAFTPILQRWIETRIEPGIVELDVFARERAVRHGTAMTLDEAIADALADLPSPATTN